jgi:S-adenosylmethionine:tRNA ribosyltransferase-isomerase
MVMWGIEGDCTIQISESVKGIPKELRTVDFDYALPPELIAAHPPPTRDGSRLMLLNRRDGAVKHAIFKDLAALLPPGCLLVLNDTKVIPARLRASKPTGGKVELLLTHSSGHDSSATWEALARGLGPAPAGTRLRVDNDISAEVVARGARGKVVLKFHGCGADEVLPLLDRIGEVPLPPYIEHARKRVAVAGGPPDDDRQRYQTVYAAAPGAVAAPTAGLHFTAQSLETIERSGHQVARLTLHVGPGTFRPVKTAEVEQHQMDEEWFQIPMVTAEAVRAARAAGRPVIAVGTTVVRALESAARGTATGQVAAGPGSSRLFLRPGDQFLVVDGLLTNFHLPCSTLLMLVAAFAGREHVLHAYAEAVRTGYRFYSYGDAMLITEEMPR